MSIGFKKSLLGFNCSDVISYIDKMHRAFSEKEKNFNSKINDLQNEINAVNLEREKLLAEKAELDRKLNEFNAKYEEIERLSENIGKLYLVAQENSKAIMKNSEENANIINQEVSRNLYTIDEAHESLEMLRNSITETSRNFVSEVDGLMNSLVVTKEQISENTDSAREAKTQFEEIYNSIVK